MNIILLKDVDNLGDKHDLVSVKPGYARNFLIPKKFAVIANATNMAKLEEIKAQEAAEEAARRGEYEEMLEELTGKVIKIGAKAGGSGKIFGSVTNLQLSSAIKEQFDLDIPRKKIELTEEVKVLGTYNANLNLHPEVKGSIVFEVVEE